MFKRVLQTTTQQNVWRPVRRILLNIDAGALKRVKSIIATHLTCSRPSIF